MSLLLTLGMLSMAFAQDPYASGSCKDACGEQSNDGCWCDAYCTDYGDCCGDFEEACDLGAEDYSDTPELSISGLVASVGDGAVTLTAEITNSGTVAASGFYIDIVTDTVADVGDYGSTYQYISYLGAGASTTLSATVSIKDSVRDVTVIVDTDGYIAESNEDDNVARTAVSDCFWYYDPAACLSAEVLLRIPQDHMRSLGIPLAEKWETYLRDELAASVEDDLYTIASLEDDKEAYELLEPVLQDDVLKGISNQDIDQLASALLPAQQEVVSIILDERMRESDTLGEWLIVAKPDGYGGGSSDASDMADEVSADLHEELFGQRLSGPDRVGLVSVGGGFLEGVVDLIENGFDGEEDSAGAKTVRSVAMTPLVAFAAMADHAVEEFKSGLNVVTIGVAVAKKVYDAVTEDDDSETEDDTSGSDDSGDESGGSDSSGGNDESGEEEDDLTGGQEAGEDGTSCPPGEDGCGGASGDSPWITWAENEGLIMGRDPGCEETSPYVDCRLVDPATEDGLGINPGELTDIIDFCGGLTEAIDVLVNWGSEMDQLNACNPGGDPESPIDEDVINPGDEEE